MSSKPFKMLCGGALPGPFSLAVGARLVKKLYAGLLVNFYAAGLGHLR